MSESSEQKAVSGQRVEPRILAMHGVGDGQVPGAAALLLGFALVFGLYFGVPEGNLGKCERIGHTAAVGFLGRAPLYPGHIRLFGGNDVALGRFLEDQVKERSVDFFERQCEFYFGHACLPFWPGWGMSPATL